MPTYEYECQACGKVHEVFHGMNDPRPRKCPACGKLKLKKRISAGAGFIFKGSGFYTTDYRSKEYKEQAKKDKPKKESGGEGKSDGKAASKGDTAKASKSGAKSGSASKSGGGDD